MKTDVFETDLRQALARRAAQIPGEAIQRLGAPGLPAARPAASAPLRPRAW